MGLWHGSNWTFIFWGIYHAFFIVLYRLVSPYTKNQSGYVFRLFSWILTLLIAMLGWIPFRAESLEVSFFMYSKLFTPSEYFYLGMRENIYLVTFSMLLLTIITYYFHENGNKLFSGNKYYTFISQSFLITISCILVFVFLRPINQFIYFQF